jgi:molybdopterin molybdotransferase
MLSVSQAQAVVLEHVAPPEPRVAPLTPHVLGRVLGEDVASDVDSPPHDKALMDGYAVRSADLPAGRGVLAVVEEITAGRTPQHALGPGQAARIMTGAPVPAGADAVVMVEKTRALDGGRVEVDDRPPRPGQNVLPRASEMRSGQVVLGAGSVLGPAELGLMAAVGRTAARVVPAPRVAVVATGDELVEPPARPGPGQIRNSNGPMLVALACRAGGLPYHLGIAQDTEAHLRALVDEGLRAEVLVLSGGVSAGKLDLVPGVLQAAGVRSLFHKVHLKPGKPVFFGTGPGGTAVFGLPGNPVSSLVCFELFVGPAVRRLAGHADPLPRTVPATLAEDCPYRSDRPTYHPARLAWEGDGWRVRPVAWLGSPDLRALTRANALVVFPPADRSPAAGETFTVLPLGH